MIVQQGQCLVDLAIQYCGDAMGIFQIALLNNISLTEGVHPGQELSEPEILNKPIQNYFYERKLTPATNDDMSSTAGGGGIGFWVINNDFIVQ